MAHLSATINEIATKPAIIGDAAVPGWASKRAWHTDIP
jgi:hypothetical protein